MGITGLRPVRLADVAKAAGVSQGTASNVFNRPNLVREEVRERVVATAQALGYAGPDPKGRLLRAGKVNAIGVATAEPLSYFFEDPFARALMTGISEACDASGAGISLVSAMSEEKLAWNIQSAVVDGFILLCVEGGHRLVELTQERKLPFVALELDSTNDEVAGIGIDDFGGARAAAVHLAELGHRRFGVLAIQFVDDRVGPISPQEAEAGIYSSARDRWRGYLAGLAPYGIDAASLPVFETQNERESVREGLEYLFSLDPKPTAILAMSDRTALIAIEWLAEQGLSVPGDVSIVGFDGIPEAAKAIPPLTTVEQPIAGIGRRAVEMILENKIPARREMMPVELVVRGTTAPPRAG